MLLVGVTLTACDVITGSGGVVSGIREVGPFSEVELSGGWTAEVSTDDFDSLVLDADDNIVRCSPHSSRRSTIRLP